jgi:hypothetical protein
LESDLRCQPCTRGVAYDEKAWRLDEAGLIKQPKTFTLDDLKTLPRREITFTLHIAEIGPRSGCRVVVHDGGYVIQGMAWGPRPIVSVEVKIDDGVWTKAKLEGSKSDYAWRQWSLDWLPIPGNHSITSRAIDAAANVQPSRDDPLIAAKKTYWESNGQITRHIHIA